MVDSAVRIHSLSIDIQRFTIKEALEKLLNSARPVRIYFVNLHSFVLMSQSERAKAAFQRAEFLLNDGIGMDIGLKLLRLSPFKENCNGTDLIAEALRRAPPHTKLFVLGARRESLLQMVGYVEKQYPQLQVVGYHDGYSMQSDSQVVSFIVSTKPDILLVGMGVPRQEIFIDTHWEELTQAGVRCAIAGGAIIDFLSGSASRAPKWVQRCHFEWFYRWLHEPRRLFKRYFIEPFFFLYLILVELYERRR